MSPSDSDGAELLLGEEERELLEDIVDEAAIAKSIVDRGRESYLNDLIAQRAAEGVLSRMGESVNRLTRIGSLVLGLPDIDFSGMKKIRDFVAHRYPIIDHDQIWQAISESVPKDAARIQGLLDGDI